jgi:hypothetical protein
MKHKNGVIAITGVIAIYSKALGLRQEPKPNQQTKDD